MNEFILHLSLTRESAARGCPSQALSHAPGPGFSPRSRRARACSSGEGGRQSADARRSNRDSADAQGDRKKHSHHDDQPGKWVRASSSSPEPARAHAGSLRKPGTPATIRGLTTGSTPPPNSARGRDGDQHASDRGLALISLHYQRICPKHQNLPSRRIRVLAVTEIRSSRVVRLILEPA